jgi:hypothetical protein
MGIPTQTRTGIPIDEEAVSSCDCIFVNKLPRTSPYWSGGDCIFVNKLPRTGLGGAFQYTTRNTYYFQLMIDSYYLSMSSNEYEYISKCDPFDVNPTACYSILQCENSSFIAERGNHDTHSYWWYTSTIMSTDNEITTRILHPLVNIIF